MSQPKVTVIDYGIGNLLSVQRALNHCGANVCVSSDTKTLARADRLILPGVGAFGDGMKSIANLGITEIIRDFADNNRPLLGICLGMQMLMDKSYEFGTHAGLGLITGNVVEIPKLGVDGNPHNIPHMGWANIYPSRNDDWGNPLLNSIKVGSAFYFVHSFYAELKDEKYCAAKCDYDGISMPAIVAKDHVYGCQFHPEKSGAVGLNVLKSFLKI